VRTQDSQIRKPQKKKAQKERCLGRYLRGAPLALSEKGGQGRVRKGCITINQDSNDGSDSSYLSGPSASCRENLPQRHKQERVRQNFHAESDRVRERKAATEGRREDFSIVDRKGILRNLKHKRNTLTCEKFKGAMKPGRLVERKSDKTKPGRQGFYSRRADLS